MGDLGAAALAEVLRNNKTLLAVEADGNDIGVAGWNLFGTAVKRNGVLQHFGFPWQDYDYSGNSLHEDQRQWFQRILLDIQHSLHANRAQHPHADAALYFPHMLPSTGPKPSYLVGLVQVFGGVGSWEGGFVSVFG